MMKACWSLVSIAGEGGGQGQHEEEGVVLKCEDWGHVKKDYLGKEEASANVATSVGESDNESNLL